MAGAKKFIEKDLNSTSRYDKIINSDTYKQAVDYSIISINA